MKYKHNNLNPQEADIVEYLKNYCNGISHAISNDALAYKFQINKRKMRNLIVHLIVNCGVPIGSCSTNHSGVYFIETEEDFKIAHRELISRIKKLSKRAKAIRKSFYKNRQLQLI